MFLIHSKHVGRITYSNKYGNIDIIQITRMEFYKRESSTSRERLKPDSLVNR